MALEEQIEKAMQLEKFNDECANRKINDMHANFVQMSGENDKTTKRIDDLHNELVETTETVERMMKKDEETPRSENKGAGSKRSGEIDEIGSKKGEEEEGEDKKEEGDEEGNPDGESLPRTKESKRSKSKLSHRGTTPGGPATSLSPEALQTVKDEMQA